MATHSFNYKGYEIWLAAIQPSKRARGGYMRTMQVRKNNIIKKHIRYDTRNARAFGEASVKATRWIDELNTTINKYNMITEFTCGIYTASYVVSEWFLKVNNTHIGSIDEQGNLLQFNHNHSRQYLSQDMLIEIAVLMNNIKRQYKQKQIA